MKSIQTDTEGGADNCDALTKTFITALIRQHIRRLDAKAKLYCVNTLNRIGNNLNQISKRVNIAHFNGEAANWTEIHEELIKIYMMMHLLFAEIRGSETGGDRND